MSDEKHDDPVTPADVTPADATPTESTPDAAAADDATTVTPATRPTAPGVVAARRARQLGGTRRPLPQPRPADDVDAAVDTSKASKAAAPVGLTKPAPKSSVGKAASRPRPRPRPTEPRAKPAEPVEPTAATDPDAPARSGRTTVIASLVLTALLLAVGVVFLVRTLTGDPQVTQRETDRALAAAKSDVALLTSYGYQTIDADAAKAAEVITGQFKDQYLQAITTVVKPQLPTSQTVAVGQVDTAGLVSADPKGRQVVVLVYCQQSVTNKAQTTPRIDALQIRVTMERVGDDWLVSQLEQLGNNA